MKSKKRKWIGVIVIALVIVIAIVIAIGYVMTSITGKVDNLEQSELKYYFSEYEVKPENITEYVKGTGEITSFNIYSFDLTNYGTIKEKYISDGTIVKTKQKLFKSSTEGTTQIVTAPIAGMFFETEIGGQTQYLIYDLNNMGVTIYVSEMDVAKLKVGQKANIKITALNKEIEGTVSHISKLPVEGSFKVKIKFNYTDDLRFGYGASVKIIIEEKENVIVLPYNAVYMDENEKYYVIKKENEKEYYDSYMNDTILPESAKTYVEIGTITNSEIEIKSGLKKGDIVAEWVW